MSRVRGLGMLLLFGAACGGPTGGQPTPSASSPSRSSEPVAALSATPDAAASAAPAASAAALASADRPTAPSADEPPLPEPELPPPPQPIAARPRIAYDDVRPPDPPMPDEAFGDQGPGPGVVMGTPSTASPAPLPKAATAPRIVHQPQCSFPPGAKDDEAAVHLRIRVGVDGKPTSVRVLTDPGEGFGAAARSCMLGATFSPGLDADGKPIEAETTVKVRFVR